MFLKCICSTSLWAVAEKENYLFFNKELLLTQFFYFPFFYYSELETDTSKCTYSFKFKDTFTFSQKIKI